MGQRKLLVKMQLPLIASQDIGDDKIHIVQTLTDTIENKIRQLEHDSQNLDFGRGEEDKSAKKRKVKEEEDTIPNKPATPNGKKSKVKSSSNLKSRQEEKSSSVAPPSSSGPGKRGAKRELDRRKDRSVSPPDLSHVDIDPDEPTYCLCDQVSYGEMIGCDNDLCPIEWFHFTCVQLTSKPKGKWF